MAYIDKRFDVYRTTSQTDLTGGTYIGECIIRIFQRNGTISNTSNLSPTTWISNVTSLFGLSGKDDIKVNVANMSSSWETFYRQFVNLLNNFSITASGSYYVRIENGIYKAVNILGDRWRLYIDGQDMGTADGLQPWCVDTTVSRIEFIYAPKIIDGKIIGTNTYLFKSINSNGTANTSGYQGVNNGTNNLILWLNGIDNYVVNPDPYGPGGESSTGGGTGTFSDTSTPIPVPSLPSISAVDSGFITLFNPNLTELNALATYMWSGGFDISTFRKIFADPMDCILGLSIVPVAVPNGGLAPVNVGNNATGLSMTKAGAQYVAVDCGTITINEYWGSYLDYSPYTKAEIYLPYIGTHALNIDDIMGKSVHVVYHVDILSGACTAYVQCGDTVLYEFIGQCASSIPISGKDWTNVINGVLGIAGSIGSMVATGGASAPMAVGAIASSAVNALKPNVEKSGSMSGTGGMMAVQIPYLIVTRPIQALPRGQNAMEGYPCYVTMSLNSVVGYTEVESVHLTGLTCTSDELKEIEELLKGGVYF